MNLEIVHPHALVKVLSDAKKLLMNENNIENRSVCYPGFLIDKGPDEVFPNITYIHSDKDKIEPLLEKGKTCVCESYDEHKQQYDLVLELRSKGKPNEFMQLVKPGGYIFSEENNGIPLALEKSKNFVLVKNLTKNSVTPPKNLSVGVFGNGSTDFFLYKRLLTGQVKKATILQRLLKVLQWHNN